TSKAPPDYRVTATLQLMRGFRCVQIVDDYGRNRKNVISICSTKLDVAVAPQAALGMCFDTAILKLEWVQATRSYTSASTNQSPVQRRMAQLDAHLGEPGVSQPHVD